MARIPAWLGGAARLASLACFTFAAAAPVRAQERSSIFDVDRPSTQPATTRSSEKTIAPADRLAALAASIGETGPVPAGTAAALHGLAYEALAREDFALAGDAAKRLGDVAGRVTPAAVGKAA